MTKVDLSHCSYLVVDDDEFQRDLVTAVLERIGGSRIFCASDSDSACKLAQQHKPDFVLLDIYMPQVDGFAMLDQLRRIHPALVVIMVTGSHTPADFGKSLDRRVDGFCIKPVLPDIMLKTLTNARTRRLAQP